MTFIYGIMLDIFMNKEIKMQTLIYLPKSLPYLDLHVTQFGKEQCSPRHFHGPAMREYYLIHYVTKGEGLFKTENEVYHLKAGEGFIICPNVVSYYEASEENPWQYYWIGFNGLQAEAILAQAKLSVQNPIFIYNKTSHLSLLFEELIRFKEKEALTLELQSLRTLFTILSLLIETNHLSTSTTQKKNNLKELYVKKAIDFIEMNYANKISVEEISHFIGLDRSYLNSLFKSFVNSSIQEYLIQYRIRKACTLLHTTSLSIGDISRSVGYEDPLVFSKSFKKIQGVSPKHYRSDRNHNREEET